MSVSHRTLATMLVLTLVCACSEEPGATGKAAPAPAPGSTSAKPPVARVEASAEAPGAPAGEATSGDQTASSHAPATAPVGAVEVTAAKAAAAPVPAPAAALQDASKPAPAPVPPMALAAQEEPKPVPKADGAQEEPKPGAKTDEPAPAAADDAASALARLTELYPRVLNRPPESAVATASGQEARLAAIKREEAWRKDVDSMNKAADSYARGLGDGAPDLTALYYCGFAKAVATKYAGSTEIGTMCDVAADALTKYLAAADEKSAYRADAEMRLGWVLLLSKKVDDAIPHLERAVELLQKESRHDAAGRCAADGLKTLSQMKRDEDLRKFADAVHAGDADFGDSTPVVRQLAAAARFTVGAPLPELPAVKDADGKDISWRPGKPMLVHFFLGSQITGDATSFREIQLEIRPLWEKHHEKGLVVVGVSMDRELPAGEADRKRKQNEEWGVKTEIRDGSLATVREWTAAQGVEWPWYWDGKALHNPLSLALGGVAQTEPYAVLVDKDGIVRWKGKAPFEGLPEAVAKLFP